MSQSFDYRRDNGADDKRGRKMAKYGGYPDCVLSARSQSHRLSVSDWFYSHYCAINQQAVGAMLAIHQVSRDNAPARWVTTLSMEALLVLPQRYSVYRCQVRKEAARADDVCAGM